MKKICLFLLLIAALVEPSFAIEEKDKALNPGKNRPKIAVVLAGGGALGTAHVGALRVLREHHIPVHIITGTSMGSIVAGAFASGRTIEEMETVLTETDWDGLFDEAVPRPLLPFRMKPGRNGEILGGTRIPLQEGASVLPVGVVRGQHVLPLFQRLFSDVPNPTSYDQLPVQFRAVAADIVTGEAFAPAQGDISRLVRASMAVPGLFAPVEIDGHLLVDGGIVNNVPVDIALALGADFLIVLDIIPNPPKQEELNSFLGIAGQMLNLLLKKSREEQRALIRPQDIHIVYNVDAYSSADFAKAAELIDIGEETTRNAIDTLKRLSVPEEEYRAYNLARTGRQPEEQLIDDIQLVNRSNFPDKKILTQLDVSVGEPLNLDVIEQNINDIYNLGVFSSVEYDVTTKDGKNTLTITAVERPWFPKYLRFGARLEDNLDGETNFEISVAFRKNNLNAAGAYFEGIGAIGKTPRIFVEWYQPLGKDEPLFIAPEAELKQEELFVRQDSDIIAEYQRLEGTVTLKGGSELGRFGELLTGYTWGGGETDREIGAQELPETSYEISEPFVGISIDTKNSPVFPTEGVTLETEFRWSLEELGADDSFNQVTGGASYPITFGRNTFMLDTDYGYTFTSRPGYRAFRHGGFLDISGFKDGELLSSDFIVGRLIYYRQIGELTLPLIGLEYFLGGSFEYASLRLDAESLTDNPNIFAGSVFLGADTPILPIYLGFGLNDESEYALYFILGRAHR